MIAADQHLRNLPAAIFGRARVVRKVQKHPAYCTWRAGHPCIFVERFILRGGLVADGAGEQARDRVDNDGGRELAATQNKIADGKFMRGEMLGDALVDTLITAANEH